jgi:hypothetical protein
MAGVAREDQVAAGVRFLQHSQVQNTPVSQRASFLEQKGLSPAEVEEALRRVRGVGEGGGVGEPEEVVVDPLWKRLLVPGALILAGLGVVGATRARDVDENALKAYHAQRQQELLEREGGDVEGESGQHLQEANRVHDSSRQSEELDRLCQAMDEQSVQLGSAVESMRALLHKMEGQGDLASRLSEVSIDINEVKRLLRSAKGLEEDACNGDGSHLQQEREVSSPQLQPELSNQQQKEGEEREEEHQPVDDSDSAKAAHLAQADRVEAVNEVIRRLEVDNEKEMIKAAAPMLKVEFFVCVTFCEIHVCAKVCDISLSLLPRRTQMFVKNLIDHQSVPRYRRVNTLNQNFLKLVAPLQGHLDFLRSVGFEGAGSQLEWAWVGGSEEEMQGHEAILKLGLDGLEALLRTVESGGGSGSPSLEEKELPSPPPGTDELPLTPSAEDEGLNLPLLNPADSPATNDGGAAGGAGVNE